MIFDLLPKYRINCVFDEFKKNFDFTTKCELPDAIEIDILEIFENVEPSINSTC
jgi:hypothetical protein